MKLEMATAVVGLEPGTIGVEDTDEVGVHAVVAVVCSDGSLREAFGFIVDGARADGIDASPIAFDLGVDLGVATVALRRWRRGGSQRCILRARSRALMVEPAEPTGRVSGPRRV